MSIELTEDDIGKRFLTESNEIVTIVQSNATQDGPAFPFLGDNGETYCAKGTVYTETSTPNDLIERLEENAGDKLQVVLVVSQSTLAQLLTQPGVKLQDVL